MQSFVTSLVPVNARRSGASCFLVCSAGTPAAASKSSASESLNVERAAPGLSARFVQWMISNPVTWTLMRNAARAVIKSSASRVGIDWDKYVSSMESRFPLEKRSRILQSFTNEAVKLPEYYCEPIHAYECGHLGWEPAFETAPASYALARIHLQESGVETVGLTGPQLFDESRGHEIEDMMKIEPRLEEMLRTNEKLTIVDGACGTGLSTEVMHTRIEKVRGNMQGVDVIALDASPYMLAVASGTINLPEVKWVHGLVEDTHMEDESIDWYNIQHCLHEVPVLTSVLEDAYRILRKGGVLTVVETDPESDSIKRMNATRMTLMKSTEPHIDVWFTFNFRKEAERVGFTVQSMMTSTRHRVYTMKK